MNKTKLFLLLASFTLLMSLDTSAEDYKTDANITVVNQYIFRGYQASQEKLAIQADYTVDLDSGLWFGLWGSNYDFGSDDGIEIDLMAGYKYQLSQQFFLELGVTRYTYSSESVSSSEYFLSISHKNLKLSYYNDVTLKTNYLSIDADLALKQDLTLQLHAATSDSQLTTIDSVNDYSVSLNFKYNENLDIYTSILKNNSSGNQVNKNFVLGVNYNL
jgi:uncharacterized protein (TIGR02001 family)